MQGSEARSDTESTNPILQLHQFSLRFRGHPEPAVDGLNLSVSAGETLCIVGESGCGKSVSAMALMGLLPQDIIDIPNGQMDFEGHRYDLRSDGLDASTRGDRMAMIFQEPMTSLNPAFRIGDQIAEAVLHHRNCTRTEATESALQMLRRVGIPAPQQRLREYPHQLSGGMRQRVMIAMALINNPSFLIADEPTTALDVTIQAQILDLIRELQSETGMGTLFITHDLGVVAEIATNVAVMYGGQIVESGPVGAVFDDPQHPYTIGLMSSVPRMSGSRDRLITVPGTVPSLADMPQGCRFRTRCPFATDNCAARPALSDVGPDHAVACHYAPLEQQDEVRCAM
ncbi:ABC transporter ATP-binding protein [Rhodobacteraceae bacterium B1Z28]|uniref:ABC transporter ATP-binding protein n=1 Tax=Ruegeria haliotis TaxID=2747601 RepID=A0ABX2PZU5_9RHOB|nr:ABC transporter ATP-binding protein [Ruegeria haliotis]NVO58534.1 ABC transporter ATP-binding protein [Ruegeria haliotis]